MAAGPGEYRVSINYDRAQVDISCDGKFTYGIIDNAIFEYSSVPTVTYTFTAKKGYMIKDIVFDNDFYFNSDEIKILDKDEGKAIMKVALEEKNADCTDISLTVVSVAEPKFNLTIEGDLNVKGKITADKSTAELVGAVPLSRTVNGKALSSNVNLTASDVGARSSTWMPTAEQVGAVSKSSLLAGVMTIGVGSGYWGGSETPGGPSEISIDILDLKETDFVMAYAVPNAGTDKGKINPSSLDLSYVVTAGCIKVRANTLPDVAITLHLLIVKN